MYHVFAFLILAYAVPLSAKYRMRVARLVGIGIAFLLRLFASTVTTAIDSYKIAITPIGGMFL